MDKILIIGFDSLDPNLISKYNLNNLKQVEYGKVFINVKPLASPIIWASFITGLKPEEHGFTGYGWKNPILDKLKLWGQKLGLHNIKLLEKISLSLFKLFELLGFNREQTSLDDNIPTIFNYATKPIVISVPGYNEELVNMEIRHEMTKHLGNPIIEKKISEKSLRIFEERKQRALKLLSDDWDLFMVHFFLPDTIQHIFWYNEIEIKKLYEEMDRTAKLFKDLVDEQKTSILFISDHGQEKGLHTPYGFYSFNHNIEIKEAKITDFANILRKELGMPSNEDIENIKERLRRLGYLG